MNLEKLSGQLQTINGKFDYINQGGCGKFALALGKKLEKEDVRFKYVLVSYADRDVPTLLSSVRKFIEYTNTLEDTNQNRAENGFLIVHILIYHKGKFIDSEGVHNSLYDAGYGSSCRLSAILEKSRLENWCNSPTWNTTFADYQMGAISREINKIKLN